MMNTGFRHVIVIDDHAIARQSTAGVPGQLAGIGTSMRCGCSVRWGPLNHFQAR